MKYGELHFFFSAEPVLMQGAGYAEFNFILRAGNQKFQVDFGLVNLDGVSGLTRGRGRSTIILTETFTTTCFSFGKGHFNEKGVSRRSRSPCDPLLSGGTREIHIKVGLENMSMAGCCRKRKGRRVPREKQ